MSTSATSSLGIGGGAFDVQGTVNALMRLEQTKMQRLNERDSTTTVSISAMGDLKSRVDAAYSAADALRSPTLLNGRSAQSSATGVADVSVNNAFTATVNNYDLNVARLASAQRSTFFGFNSKTATMGTGNGANTLTIEIPASSLLADNSTAMTRTFSLQGKSLTDLLQEINNDPDLKNRVSGSLVNTNGAAGWALVLSGLKTGDDARFVATWDGDPSLCESMASVRTVGGFSSASSEGTLDPSFSPSASSNKVTIEIPASSSLGGGTQISVAFSLLTETSPPKVKSLANLRDAINSSPDLGGKVSAHVINQGGANGWAIVLKGASAASDARFNVTWDAELDVQQSSISPQGSKPLSYGPVNGVTDLSAAVYSDADKAFVNGGASAALDAQATLNGLVVESATNTFSDAIAGVSLTVKTKGTATIQVADNRDGITSAVKALASALTALNTKALEVSKPGNEKTKAGPLASNSGVLSLQSAVMSSYISGFTLSANPSTQRSWAALGIEVQRDGSFTVNGGKLDEFLTGTSGLTASEVQTYGNGARMLAAGFATSGLVSVLDRFRGTSGSMQSTIDYLNVTKQSLQRDKDTETGRLERTRAALLKKYAALDAQLTKMNQMRNNVSASLSKLGG